MYAQIHIIGTGGGYGESILVNLGNDEWVIVDSCKDPNSGRCLPLKFLEERSINPNQVKLIVCTHWHDDHIRGMSELLNNCSEAIFSIAKINDRKKFLRFVRLDYLKISTSASKCSTFEFNKCIDIQKRRRAQTKYAFADRLLYWTKYQDQVLCVHSLSPSDLSLDLFDQEISSLIDRFGSPGKKIVTQSINDKSVVLLLTLGVHSILLGSDLEVKYEPNAGWNDITNNSQIVGLAPKASFIKIPHHGSENGYSKSIWQNLMKHSPIGALTPWNKKYGLPRRSMLNLYRRITRELYITSSMPFSKKPKRRNPRVSKMIKEFNTSIREIKYNYGIISSEIKIDENSAEWSSQCIGTASKCV